MNEATGLYHNLGKGEFEEGTAAERGFQHDQGGEACSRFTLGAIRKAGPRHPSLGMPGLAIPNLDSGDFAPENDPSLAWVEVHPGPRALLCGWCDQQAVNRGRWLNFG